MRRILIAATALLVMLSTSAAGILAFGGQYRVSVVLASAANLVEGTLVKVNGFDAGTIESIDVADGKAKLTLGLDDDFAPLHDGAQVAITWKAVLGERLVDVHDGPEENATIPSGGMIPGGQQTPVELDNVLAALDQPTRDKVNSLVRNLDATLSGSEPDLNATLKTAGPAVAELGNVLRGLGTDGESIKQLVAQLNRTMEILAERDGDVAKVVDQLGGAVDQVAAQQQALGETIHGLPGTLKQAKTTLGNVPDTINDAVPLLDALRPATEKLPSVTANLRPLLADLRPAIGDLRPTLESASELLQHTPGLLDSSAATFPQIEQTFAGLGPALQYLRPYTPELAGFLTNWNSANANYDRNGHYARIYVTAGLENVNVNPGVLPPGTTKNLSPLPGELVDQSWTDAFGEAMR
ncbi:phospholipid/cholesterol/gamma-HCH transport system substrate-binding protein [Pseudonocardia ammonioxydans]|uniref:Phospholipid/cholesterol/gamma-HCH transport system substrate-binding protein n=1 Tax=Pseudonocardia ammonioxydans TaxID=260086 RepID=A0A1I5HQ91_PSUAM|nr:MlaD family protein [Pseudonocardia ammonioxydans]SFO50484.1 phospholipid/cholesterol/gamma-HCH transport system substrate-binding protein [Pseudonocardia ammonioxydans]